MAAVVLTLTLCVIFAGGTWLMVGARLPLDADPRQNDILNLFAYAGITLVVVLPFVFFVIEQL
ncbi:MAG: hypothetical protein HC809_02025 [Gammaproteobacteria bacterium]|nr:hypothetical protein [Gammaproteobacteria bacterium]